MKNSHPFNDLWDFFGIRLNINLFKCLIWNFILAFYTCLLLNVSSSTSDYFTYNISFFANQIQSFENQFYPLKTESIFLRRNFYISKHSYFSLRKVEFGLRRMKIIVWSISFIKSREKTFYLNMPNSTIFISSFR